MSPANKPETQTRGKRGKYGRITPEVLEAIYLRIEQGDTRQQACAASGVGYTTLWAYLKNHPDFEERLKAARQVSNSNLNACIVSAALGRVDDKGVIVKEGDWKAAAWLLERRDREEYGRRDPDSLSRQQAVDAMTKFMVTLLVAVPSKYHAAMERRAENFFEALLQDGWVAD